MTAQKISISKLIENLVANAKDIENSEIPQSRKTERFKRLAVSFVNSMYGDGRKKEENKIAISTARSYLTKARKAIAAFTGLHHGFESSIARMVKKYPLHSDSLLALLDMSPKDTRVAKKNLLEQLAHASEISAKVDALDFSKKKVDKQIGSLCIEYPVYENLLDKLYEKTEVTQAKVVINKAVNEAKEVFEELSQVKVDHELIVHLVLPSSDKAMLAKKAKQNLNTKKNSVVYVDYPKYMQQITNVLAEPKFHFNGLVEGVAPLIFSLCAASGRRPIEIIKTGDFKAKGKFGLVFSGQAKKRDEDEEEQPRLIYSLVESEMFIAAFNILRQSNVIVDMVKNSDFESSKSINRTSNDIISGKISPHLSEFTKNFFVDKKRVFKDTRGIYGRICYQRFYLVDRRWANKDEDIFFYELFGHSDTNAQAHYKPYKLNNFTADVLFTAEVNERWQALCELDEEMPGLARKDAAIELHEWVKSAVLANPAIEINQSMLTKNTGKFRGTIKNYLAVIDELAAPGEALTSYGIDDEDDVDTENADDKPVNVDKPKPKLTKAVKPTMTAKLIAENEWQVIIKQGNVTKLYDLVCKEKIEAMTLAYGLYVGDLFYFTVVLNFRGKPTYQLNNIIAESEAAAETFAIKAAARDNLKTKPIKVKVTRVND